jgi:hypothetical protein
MKELIDALKKQIRIEEFKYEARKIQLANPTDFIGKPLQECRSPEFQLQMKRAVQILLAVQDVTDTLEQEHLIDCTVTAEEFELKYKGMVQLKITATMDVLEFTEVKQY